MTNTKKKLLSLRACMRKKKIDAWIITSVDPHNSEYVAAHWKGREWLSGFTGSAGTVIVVQKEAALWTDGRYFLQASEEIKNSGIQLIKTGTKGALDITEWLIRKLTKGSVIGFDGKTFSLQQYDEYCKVFKPFNFVIKSNIDLLDYIWEDRPAKPNTEIYEHELQYAGKDRESKISEVRIAMASNKATHMILSGLDDIAWLLNLRASDIKHNPVFIAYLILTDRTITLYTHINTINKNTLNSLKKSDIQLAEYGGVERDLKKISKNTQLLLDSRNTSCWLANALSLKVSILDKQNPTILLKSIKNDIEIKGVRLSHVLDGVALTKTLYWIDKNISKGRVTEILLDEHLRKNREESDFFIEPSFPTIAGYQENGAIIHYQATKKTCKQIKPKSFLLIDSGGQYYNGTTDVTRTIACGKLKEDEKKDYTMVLKAHISLAKAKFIKGTSGSQLDILARQWLWNFGKNYNHGTGHGVGYCLNVHEGPQNISSIFCSQSLEIGMLITNEPGIYIQNKYGIRIENIMLVTQDISTEFGDFYKFETLTLAPIDLRPIITGMLNEEEINWLNEYHINVRKKLGSFLQEDEKDWLIKSTKSIEKL